jgi:hypothetical protein
MYAPIKTLRSMKTEAVIASVDVALKKSPSPIAVAIVTEVYHEYMYLHHNGKERGLHGLMQRQR